MWYVALISSTGTSLMIMASSVDSQSPLGDIKLEYWSKGLNRFSSSAALYNGSAISVWLSYVEVMVSITSFITVSCDLGISDWVLCRFLILLYH